MSETNSNTAKKSQYKKQHYVPQMHLEYFVENPSDAVQTPYLWVFDTFNLSSKKRAPKNIAYINNFYDLDLNNDFDKKSVEKMFAVIEDKAKVSYETAIKLHIIDDKEKANFAFYIMGLIVRTPNFINNLKDFDNRAMKLILDHAIQNESMINNIVDKIKKEKKIDEPFDIEKLKESIDDFTFVQSDPAYIFQILKQMEKQYPYLLKMNWCILTNNSPVKFITSDTPVTFVTIPQPFPNLYTMGGLGMNSVEVTFPICPEICIFASYEDIPLTKEVSEDIVMEINKRQITFADQELYSNHEIDINYLAKIQDRSLRKIKLID